MIKISLIQKARTEIPLCETSGQVMRGTAPLSHPTWMKRGLWGPALLMGLRIDPGFVCTWFLISQPRPPAKPLLKPWLVSLGWFSYGPSLFNLIFWDWKTLFLFYIHFISQTPHKTLWTPSFPLLQAQRKSHSSSWSSPANPKYLHLPFFWTTVALFAMF